MAELTVVDASVLIAWLDRNDAHHTAAIDVLAADRSFVAPALTVAEVLVHPTRSGRAHNVMTRLEAIGLVVSDRGTDPVALAQLRADSRLKMPDCVVLSCALAHDADLATFDESLAAAFDRVRPRG